MYLSMKSLTLLLLAMFIDIVTYDAFVFVEFIALIKECIGQTGTMILAAQILGPIGKINEVCVLFHIAFYDFCG